jgi:hypothetical protein
MFNILIHWCGAILIYSCGTSLWCCFSSRPNQSVTPPPTPLRSACPLAVYTTLLQLLQSLSFSVAAVAAVAAASLCCATWPPALYTGVAHAACQLALSTEASIQAALRNSDSNPPSMSAAGKASQQLAKHVRSRQRIYSSQHQAVASEHSAPRTLPRIARALSLSRTCRQRATSVCGLKLLVYVTCHECEHLNCTLHSSGFA